MQAKRLPSDSSMESRSTLLCPDFAGLSLTIYHDDATWGTWIKFISSQKEVHTLFDTVIETEKSKLYSKWEQTIAADAKVSFCHSAKNLESEYRLFINNLERILQRSTGKSTSIPQLENSGGVAVPTFSRGETGSSHNQQNVGEGIPWAWIWMDWKGGDH